MDTDVISFDQEVKIADGDYVLVDEAAWFTVKGFAIRVRNHGVELRGNSGIIIDVYVDDKDDLSEPLDTMVLFDADIAR